MAEHACKVLHRDVMREDEGCETVAAEMERNVLGDAGLLLNKVKVVVSLLVGDVRQLVAVLLQYFQSRCEDRSEERSLSLDTHTVDVVHVAVLDCHCLEVEQLSVAVGKTGVGGEDEEVADLDELVVMRTVELEVADLLYFLLGKRLAVLALAALDRHVVVGIGRNHLHERHQTGELAEMLVVGVYAYVRACSVMEPLVESCDVGGSEILEGLNLAETLQRVDGHLLLTAGVGFDVLLIDRLLEVGDEVGVLVYTFIKVLGTGSLLLLLFLVIEVGVEVVNVHLKVEDGQGGDDLLAAVHQLQDFLALRVLLELAALAPAG